MTRSIETPHSATATACANIALVKYWGKRDVALNLPMAGSLSLTLDALTTTTTVRFAPPEHRTIGIGASAGSAAEEPGDRLEIDGALAAPAALRKAQRVLGLIRERAGLDGPARIGPARIDSRNAFPTAAGLASSASGLAALTVAAARAAGLDLPPAELSAIARQGSGSACRSLFGGFVEWAPGLADDGSDSHGRQLHDRAHWPDLRVVVAVISSQPKAVGSTAGMRGTARTSPRYLGAFVGGVPDDLAAARAAIAARDIFALAPVAERSCLRMHAAMIAGDPPLIYLAPESWRVIEAVRRAREREGLAAFFTADAGPNVKVFCSGEAAPRVQQMIESLGVVERTFTASPGPGPVVCEEQ